MENYAMCLGMFKTPKMPAQPAPVQVPAPAPVPAVTPPPTAAPATNTVTNTVTETAMQTPQEQDKDVSEVKRRERDRIANRTAENNTLVTGGSGLADVAETGTKKLLGA